MRPSGQPRDVGDAMTAEPVHRTILVLDIVEFAHPQRTDPARLRLREELYELIHQTLIAAVVDPEHAPCVDLGDGVIVLLDPQLAATRVVEVVIGQLRTSLAALNRRAPGNERLRLRVALHRGEVVRDAHGFVGAALVEASRLSNAAALRQQLDDTAADLGLIVSDQVWKQLTGSSHDPLDQALAGVGIDERHHDPTGDRGDGFLLLLHPVDEVPKTLLLGGLLPGLSARLAAYNHGAPPAERLLLRAALHAGEVHHDPNGPFGGPIDVTFRLLEAPAFKAYRRRRGEPLVLVVSGDIYRSVVWHGYPGIDRDAYRQLFRVRVAGRSHQGWVRGP